MYVCYALSKREPRNVRAVACQNRRVLAMGCRGRGIATDPEVVVVIYDVENVVKPEDKNNI